MPAGALARCLSVSAEEFGRDHWGKRPLLSLAKELPGDFSDLLSRDDVDDLLADRALRTPFFRQVSEGKGLPDAVRVATAGNRRIGDLVDVDVMHRQHSDGATLVLQSLHRLHPPVAAFCRALAQELGHQTQCNAYLTPAGDAQGFAFHHDTHDVLVLQVSGRKRWIVHEPVLAHPLASQPRSGAHLVREDADPLLDVELEAGDCLYLPRGFVHAAQTTDVHSVHLTIGLLVTTAYDVLSDVLKLAAQDERFRQSLPMAPGEGLAAVLPALLRDAAEWWAQLDVAQAEAVVQQRLVTALPIEPLRLLAQAEAIEQLDPMTRVRVRRGLRLTPNETADAVELTLTDRTISLPVAAAAAVARLLTGPGCASDLAVGGLTAEDGMVIVRRLLREAVLVPDSP